MPIPDLDPNFRYVDKDGHESITQHFKNGSIYYYSDIISKLWNKGNILIGECSYKSCAYVARYVVKKQKGKSSEVYKNLGVEEPFVRMSRMPGLAQRYYESNKDILIEEDKIYLAEQNGSKIVKPPRYFDKQTELYNEIAYYANKERRQKRSEEVLNTLYNQTNLHYDEYLEVLENNKNLQIRLLQRKI